MLALATAMFAFQSTAPAAIQDRYLIPILPPLLFLAALAVRHLSADWRWQAAIPAAAFATALPLLPPAEPKHAYGMIPPAAVIWAHRLPANPSVLIATDGGAEGAAIAELAMLDPARPSLFAVRGSRLLGGGGYNTHEYEPRFETPAQVMAAIDRYAIPLVLLRGVPGQNAWRHIDQIEQARAMAPQRWEILYQATQGPVEIRLYRLRDNAGKTADITALRALGAPRSMGRQGE